MYTIKIFDNSPSCCRFITQALALFYKGSSQRLIYISYVTFSVFKGNKTILVLSDRGM